MTQQTENLQTTSDQVIQVTSTPVEGDEFAAFAIKLVVVPETEIDAVRTHRGRLLRGLRSPGQRMTDEINADPDEVARLRLSRQQAREGMVRWDPEDGGDGAE